MHITVVMSTNTNIVVLAYAYITYQPGNDMHIHPHHHPPASVYSIVVRASDVRASNKIDQQEKYVYFSSRIAWTKWAPTCEGANITQVSILVVTVSRPGCSTHALANICSRYPVSRPPSAKKVVSRTSDRGRRVYSFCSASVVSAFIWSSKVCHNFITRACDLLILCVNECLHTVVYLSLCTTCIYIRFFLLIL